MDWIEKLFGAAPFICFKGTKFVTQDLFQRARKSQDRIAETMLFSPAGLFSNYLPKMMFISGPNQEIVKEALDAKSDPAQRDFFRSLTDVIFNFDDTPLQMTIFPFRANDEVEDGRKCLRHYFVKDGLFIKTFTQEFEDEMKAVALLNQPTQVCQRFAYKFHLIFSKVFMGVNYLPDKVSYFSEEIEKSATEDIQPWKIFGYYIGITPSQRHCLRIKREILDFMRQLLIDNKETILSTQNFTHDILNELVSKNKGKTVEDLYLSPHMVAASFYVFGALGNTEILLSSVVGLLIDHPNVRKKLEADFESYFDKFYCELLRWVTPTPLIGRSYSIGRQLGNHYITPGTIAFISLEAIHYDPAFWSNPEEFNPDRPELDIHKLNSYPLIPFITGSRICLSIVNFRQLIRNFTQLCLKYKMSSNQRFSLKRTGVSVRAPKDYKVQFD